MKIITSQALKVAVREQFPNTTLKAASEAVAERCQTSPRTVRCYISGERRPSRLFSTLFAEAYGPLPASAWIEYVRRQPTGDARTAAQAGELAEVRREALKLQRVIDRFCMACVGAETIAEARCWDSTCGLRSVSRAELSAKALTERPIVVDNRG